MSTLSVPLDAKQENFVEQMIQEGYAENKAQVVRKALRKLAEDRLMEEILEARAEHRAGKSFTGDLRKIVKRFPNE